MKLNNKKTGGVFGVLETEPVSHLEETLLARYPRDGWRWSGLQFRSNYLCWVKTIQLWQRRTLKLSGRTACTATSWQHQGTPIVSRCVLMLTTTGQSQKVSDAKAWSSRIQQKIGTIYERPWALSRGSTCILLQDCAAKSTTWLTWALPWRKDYC